jgi:hypothetical protein
VQEKTLSTPPRLTTCLAAGAVHQNVLREPGQPPAGGKGTTHVSRSLLLRLAALAASFWLCVAVGCSRRSSPTQSTGLVPVTVSVPIRRDVTDYAEFTGVTAAIDLVQVLATGPGAEMRQALGTAVFSGMIGVTAFGIFLTPVFFYVLSRLGSGRRDRIASEGEARLS